MTIIELTSIVLTFCSVIPEKCIMVDNPEERVTSITICDNKLKINRILNIGIIDLDYPENNRVITLDTSCTNI